MTEHKIIILDHDNVLADDEWRIRTIDWDQENCDNRYHLYHINSIFDSPANKQLLDADAFIVVFTAMPEVYRSLRENWYVKHNLKVDMLVMRGAFDHRPSVEIKRSMLQYLRRRLCSLHQNTIVAAYDDRDDIVQMYIDEGVNGIKVQVHNKCAWSRPEGWI